MIHLSKIIDILILTYLACIRYLCLDIGVRCVNESHAYDDPNIILSRGFCRIARKNNTFYEAFYKSFIVY